MNSDSNGCMTVHTEASSSSAPSRLLERTAQGKPIVPGEATISYHPRWNEFTGSIESTLFLQHVAHWWKQGSHRPFHKFAQPCTHWLYRPGESWLEELNLSRREFEGARAGVATRTRGKLDPNNFVTYWVDVNHTTWYELNEHKLGTVLISLGQGFDPLPISPYEYQPSRRDRSVRAQLGNNRTAIYAALVDRDGEGCRHCGKTHDLTIDHILAVANGGGNELANLQLLCRPCNSRKGAK